MCNLVYSFNTLGAERPKIALICHQGIVLRVPYENHSIVKEDCHV